MGFIEKLKQEKEAIEQGKAIQQAKLTEAEALHQQRREQAATFRTESGIGDLALTAADLLKKVRFPDASYSNGQAIQNQSITEVDSVFDSIRWGKLSRTSYMRSPRKGNYYVSIATRPNGQIVFYAQKEILIPETDWRKDKDLLERTLEQALNLPGEAYEPEKEINYGPYIPPLKPNF